MVERYRRGKGKRKLLGSHQRCWIWGRHVVTETLWAARWIPLELHLAETVPLTDREALARQAVRHDISVLIEPPGRLRALCHSDEHQGYLAKMPEFPYASADELIAQAHRASLYVVLQGIQDPYNLGGILRSAEVFGADGLFLQRGGQVGVTSLVARTSAGAVNHLPIARVPELTDLILQLRQRGVSTVAAHPLAERLLFDQDFSRPTAIVIGNESRGISEALRKHCHAEVRIPQRGRVGSLNAAAAASIVLYEVARQCGRLNP